ncbi:hypothetical protein PC116_g20409 [Phytophthora cactorum]|uniref:Uncharacterized protein n=1 Tax=Phytophthora cactorum TaxID=29920 RepID=A0A8T1FFV0_9STRA|nr:hypothetical protein PC112_g18338 [Phytophthora cactorum]KAG2806683.1 hypothetical protein PC111_g17253 [Phytophthora cactorum]KAG2849907.1 hypothetical protein PC113_g17273 [Phytophthora cactorum]KAG2879655.1 hypothetical protein PC114_g22453 [Phytophthora cactorum]KAG2971708.1 hypothetical protein PC118_g16144 [Phytophthora cactorum]
MNKTILETRVAALPLIMTLPNWNRDQRDQRKVSFVQVIVSTKANERSRSAEDLHNEVEWLQDGCHAQSLFI